MDMVNNPYIDQAVKVLNEALLSDHDALKNLINCRVPCNDILRDHESIQVGVNKLNIASISTLGLINGILGIEPLTGFGFVNMICEGHMSSNKVYIIDKIIKFSITDFSKIPKLANGDNNPSYQRVV